MPSISAVEQPGGGWHPGGPGRPICDAPHQPSPITDATRFRSVLTSCKVHGTASPTGAADETPRLNTRRVRVGSLDKLGTHPTASKSAPRYSSIRLTQGRRRARAVPFRRISAQNFPLLISAVTAPLARQLGDRMTVLAAVLESGCGTKRTCRDSLTDVRSPG